VQKEFWLESLQGRGVGVDCRVMDLGEMGFKGLTGFN
jgi:hypothetical protein